MDKPARMWASCCTDSDFPFPWIYTRCPMEVDSLPRRCGLAVLLMWASCRTIRAFCHEDAGFLAVLTRAFYHSDTVLLQRYRVHVKCTRTFLPLGCNNLTGMVRDAPTSKFIAALQLSDGCPAPRCAKCPSKRYEQLLRSGLSRDPSTSSFRPLRP